MEYRYQSGGEEHLVRLIARPDGDGYDVLIGDRSYHVRARSLDGSTFDLWIDGQFRRVRHAAQGDERWLSLDGRPRQATSIRHRRKRRSGGGGEESLAASMPGQIVAVLVSPGDEVSQGQPLVLMEAMKMELRVTAPHDGRVARILVAEGETVERGQALVEMKGKQP